MKKMKCKKCKDEIVFVSTSTGKHIPVDFKSLSDLDLRYLQLVNANKSPIKFRSGEHRYHNCSNPAPRKVSIRLHTGIIPLRESSEKEKMNKELAN